MNHVPDLFLPLAPLIHPQLSEKHPIFHFIGFHLKQDSTEPFAAMLDWSGSKKARCILLHYPSPNELREFLMQVKTRHGPLLPDVKNLIEYVLRVRAPVLPYDVQS